jgi:alkylhydroperoxidase family enzyme
MSVRFEKTDETNERFFALAAWKDAPDFTDTERAALALSEAVHPTERSFRSGSR